LASCGRDRTIWIWEKATDASEIDGEGDVTDAENWDCSDVKNDHSKDVKNIIWHPHHNILVSMSYDDSVKFFYKYGEDWKCYDSLNAHSSTVWSADFSSSGEYLVTCSDDKTVRIWRNTAHNLLPSVEENSWKCTSVIQGYQSRSIYDVSWGKQADVIVSASGDNSIAIYERDQSNPQEKDLFICVQKYTQAHRCDVNSVCWNPHRSLVATGGDDRFVKLWDYSNSRSDEQGMKVMSIVDGILKDLSEATLNSGSASERLDKEQQDQTDSQQFSDMQIKINNYETLYQTTKRLQILQNEIYSDEEKRHLSKTLDLKLSGENLPAVVLSGLKFDEAAGVVQEFLVELVDDRDTVKYRFKLIIDTGFNLALPRRSSKLLTVAKELFLIEKTGDLFKISPDGQSIFLLGHLFTFSDVQFVLHNELEDKENGIKFIISADRDEKIRITNYPDTFDIERYCFGHKHLLSRIIVVDEWNFISIDVEGEVCQWNLTDLVKQGGCKPLSPVRVISANENVSRKRQKVQ